MGSMLNLQTGDALTMTSREIADLVESRHADVCRTIERLMDGGSISRYAPTAYTHPQNSQQYNEFHIRQRDSYVIVAQLSPEFTARLVDRWQELERSAPAPSLPRSFAEALRLAADQQDVITAQAEQLAAAAPAVEFVERYADATGTMGFRQVCKLLGANENQFREFLIERAIMYRLGRELTPHAQHIDAGRFCVKTGTAQISGHAYNAARFTPKGVTWVAGEWAKWQLEQRQQGTKG